ncbi:MAG: tRNA ligase, partial [Candidatus Diapherotrites archaeon]|nr:tRNA ligase [Candidatus Diapherotrites archaeon]
EILCRLDVKQCEKTKVTDGTQNILLYVQGNPNTSEEQVKSALQEITELVERFCGGKITRLI